MKHVDHVLSTIIIDQMTEQTARIHCLVDLLKRETPLISLNITRPSPHSSYFVPQPHQRALICALILTTVPPNQKSRKCPRCELLLLTSKKQSGDATANAIPAMPNWQYIAKALPVFLLRWLHATPKSTIETTIPKLPNWRVCVCVCVCEESEFRATSRPTHHTLACTWTLRTTPTITPNPKP